MAEPFLSLGARERADILRTVAARSRRSAVILEKDIWVCWDRQGLDRRHLKVYRQTGVAYPARLGMARPGADGELAVRPCQ